MGAAYVYLPALGNRNAFTGDPAELADPERAVDPIATLLVRGPNALLCGCADTHRCRRDLVADFPAERLGAEVIHLSAPARSPRNDGGQLTLPGL